MYNDLVDVAWRAFVKIYEPYPSVVAMGAIQRAFIWFRFRFFACRVSVQFSLGPFFPCTYFGGYRPVNPSPASPLSLSAVLLLVDMWCECKCGSGSVCGTYIMRLSLSARLRFKWECEWALFFLLFFLFFLMLIEMRQRRDISTQEEWEGAWEPRAVGEREGERETGQVSTVVEVSYSFDCLPNCRVSSPSPSLCAYSSSLLPCLMPQPNSESCLTYKCV